MKAQHHTLSAMPPRRPAQPEAGVPLYLPAFESPALIEPETEEQAAEADFGAEAGGFTLWLGAGED